jgi:probable F420-dependent oxidoreductase
MRFGFHLPQFGRAIVTGGIERAAVQAEELGYNDVWVSDHLIVPADQAYPVPYLYDPLMALAFAAATTNRIGIGTSVLVATQYTSPLALANTLASLDHLSGGRLTVGAGIGWSQAEYEALGAPFDHRGRRLEEILALWQTAWHEDPATHTGKYYPFQQMRVLPKPAHEIPVWLGGTSDEALHRALRLAQGYQGIGVEPGTAAALVERIREERPDEDFTISLRVPWDARSDDDGVQAAVASYASAGVQHLLFTPDRGDLETWLAGMARLARQLDLPA